MADSPQGMQVVMHAALREDFERWLNARGLLLNRTPFLDDEEDTDGVFPTYLVTPHPDRMKERMKP